MVQIDYLFDPLCGWCYGAGPVLDQLAQLDDVTLTLAPTGLFAGQGARADDGPQKRGLRFTTLVNLRIPPSTCRGGW